MSGRRSRFLRECVNTFLGGLAVALPTLILLAYLARS